MHVAINYLSGSPASPANREIVLRRIYFLCVGITKYNIRSCITHVWCLFPMFGLESWRWLAQSESDRVVTCQRSTISGLSKSDLLLWLVIIEFVADPYLSAWPSLWWLHRLWESNWFYSIQIADFKSSDQLWLWRPNMWLDGTYAVLGFHPAMVSGERIHTIQLWILAKWCRSDWRHCLCLSCWVMRRQYQISPQLFWWWSTKYNWQAS